MKKLRITLDVLPIDIIREILHHLHPRDIKILFKTTHRLKNIIIKLLNDDIFNKRLVQRYAIKMTIRYPKKEIKILPMLSLFSTNTFIYDSKKLAQYDKNKYLITVDHTYFKNLCATRLYDKVNDPSLCILKIKNDNKKTNVLLYKNIEKIMLVNITKVNYLKQFSVRILSLKNVQFNSSCFKYMKCLSTLIIGECYNVTNLEYLSSLKELEMTYCKLVNIPKLPTSILYLTLSNNDIIDLQSISDLVNLVSLRADYNKISAINLYLPKLVSINVKYNRLTNSKFLLKFPNLEHALIWNYTLKKCVSLRRLKKMQYVNVCGLTKISLIDRLFYNIYYDTNVY